MIDTGNLPPGGDEVCGKGRPNADGCLCVVWLKPDGSREDLGCGSSDGEGDFCIPVDPPLVAGQIIIVEDRCGDPVVPSQPELVGATPAPTLGSLGLLISVSLLAVTGLIGMRRLRQQPARRR